MLLHNWEVRVKHEANVCADALANIGCNLDCITCIYEQPPIDVRQLLLADERVVSASRVVKMYFFGAFAPFNTEKRN